MKDITERFVDIVFDGPPSHESGRFVEVENPQGASFNFGEWVQRDDGYWALRITESDARSYFGESTSSVLDQLADQGEIDRLRQENLDLRINLKGLEAFRRTVWREALKVDRSVDEMALALFLDGLEPKARRSVVAEAVAKGTTIWGVLPEALRGALRKQARDLIRTLRNSAEEATDDV